jgi:rhamnogalacturonyl hydrolase YesR
MCIGSSCRWWQTQIKENGTATVAIRHRQTGKLIIFLYFGDADQKSDHLTKSLRFILQEHGQSPGVYQAINKVLGVSFD